MRRRLYLFAFPAYIWLLMTVVLCSIFTLVWEYLVLRRYQDYLDQQVTATDLYYLGDADLARQLVELGCV